jgi:membrane protein implicated in regulation of membrane protease activity
VTKPKTLWLLIGLVMLALVWEMARSQPVQAQVGQSLAERQVVALEKIASELGRIRRDGIKRR